MMYCYVLSLTAMPFYNTCIVLRVIDFVFILEVDSDYSLNLPCDVFAFLLVCMRLTQTIIARKQHFLF